MWTRVGLVKGAVCLGGGGYRPNYGKCGWWWFGSLVLGRLT